MNKSPFFSLLTLVMLAELTWKDVSAEVFRLVKAGLESPQISDILSPVGEAIGVREGPINAPWGGPRPLASMLAGGALGAGAGYGAGWLAEHLLPDYFPKKRIRKSLGVLGAAVGAIPGGMQSIDNWSQGQGVLDRWPTPVKQGTLLELAHAELDDRYPDLVKLAQGTSALGDFVPSVDRDVLHQVIWRDPLIPQSIAAATEGLVDSASLLRGGSRYVTPFDVGRIAVGMGSGLVSGLVVGRALGALTGLSDAAQNRLVQAGTLAGFLKSVVPMVFGDR